MTRVAVRRLAPALLLAGCASGGGGTSPALPPGVTLTGNVQRYAITGRTEYEVAQSLDQNAIDRSKGYIGMDTYQLHWTFATKPSAEGCALDSVRVRIEATVQLPEWRRPSGVPNELVAAWDTFLGALEEHERGHVRISIDDAAQLVRALGHVSAPTCLGAVQEANRVARLAFDADAARQADFDTNTGHGSRAGVVWPPSR